MVGDRAHWCLVIGYYDEATTKHVIATHRAKYWDWTAKGLIDSNLSLKAWTETEYAKDNPSDWNPKGTKKGPFLGERTVKAASLDLTLRGFIVVI